MILHRFHSDFPDAPNPDILRPSDWNASHVFSDAVDGGLILGAPNDPETYQWLAPGAAGTVLGGGSVPSWTNTVSRLTFNAAYDFNNPALLVDEGFILFKTSTNTNTQFVIAGDGGRAGIIFKSFDIVSNQFGYLIADGAPSNITGSVTFPVDHGLRIGGNVLALQENGGFVVLGATAHFGIGGTSNAFPSLTRSASDTTASFRVRLGDDSGYADVRVRDLYANMDGAASGAGKLRIGGIDAGRQYGGIWGGAATPDFSNFSFLSNVPGGSTPAITIFNAPGPQSGTSAGLLDFRVGNNSRFIVGPVGVSINEPGNTVPTNPLKIQNSSHTNVLLTLTDTGQLTLRLAGLGAFVAGDKYLVIDASGNIHVSAIGPAS